MLIKKNFQIRPRPANQLGKEFLAILIITATVVLTVAVHWTAGVVFFVFCLAASFFTGRPRIQE